MPFALPGQTIVKRRGKRRLLTNGVAVPGLPVKVLAEGDSITDDSSAPTKYVNQWAALHPTVTFDNYAVGGSQIPTMVARQAAALSYHPSLLTVLIGANDLTSDASGYAASLWAYTDQFRAYGCKLIVGTVLPRAVGGQSSVVSGWATKRANFNALLRAAVGVKVDDIFDFDTCPMGVDGAESDPTLYNSADQLHPVQHGQDLLFRVASPVISHMLGIPNEPFDFAFAPQAAATTDTDYDSAPYSVAGFYPGESRPYSVSSGAKVSKNGGTFTLNGSGTVVNTDTLKVRNHSSTSAATQTDVTLTVGVTTATYSVTTAGAGTRDWVPTDLGSKLKLWLKPEAITDADAAEITTWPDSSGNSVTVTGSGSSSKPEVVAGGLNGFKTAKFEGAKQSKFSLPAGYLTSRTASAGFFVSKNVKDPNDSYFAPPLGDWGTDGSGEFYPYVSGDVYSSFCTNTRNQITNPSPGLDSWRFASFHSAASDWRYYIDGTAFATLTSSTFAAGSAPKIGCSDGGGSFFDGQIAEVVECNSVLTTTERQLVEGYLAWKFGLQAHLPTGHPYLSAKPTI